MKGVAPQKPPPSPSTYAGTTPDAGVVVAAVDATIVDAAPATPDEAFREAIRAQAKARHRLITSWGTVRLDGEHPTRFAALDVEVDPKTGDRLVGEGAYVFERPQGDYLMVNYWWYERPFGTPEGDRPAGEPEWIEYPDKWITHVSHFTRNTHDIQFGLRKGQLVVFYFEEYRDHEDKTNKHRFARNGVCKPRCPALATFSFAPGMHVTGPSKTVADLPDPPGLN
jgi:hypothetical protein